MCKSRCDDIWCTIPTIMLPALPYMHGRKRKCGITSPQSGASSRAPPPISSGGEGEVCMEKSARLRVGVLLVSETIENKSVGGGHPLERAACAFPKVVRDCGWLSATSHRWGGQGGVCTDVYVLPERETRCVFFQNWGSVHQTQIL